MSSDQRRNLTESHVSTVIPLSMSINYDCPMSFPCPLVAAHSIWYSNWRSPLWGTQPHLRSQSGNQRQRVYPRWTDHVSGLCKTPTLRRPREFCWSAKVEKKEGSWQISEYFNRSSVGCTKRQQNLNSSLQSCIVTTTTITSPCRKVSVIEIISTIIIGIVINSRPINIIKLLINVPSVQQRIPFSFL